MNGFIKKKKIDDQPKESRQKEREVICTDGTNRKQIPRR